MNDKLFDLYGYTWDEAPKHLKKYALHLSGALKIDKFEAYELLINKCFEKEIEEWRQKRKQKGAVNSTKVAKRIFDKLRSFSSQDRKKALENAITAGWKDIYEVKKGYKPEEPKNHPAQKVFRYSDSDMPPTLKELGLDKAMNGEN